MVTVGVVLLLLAGVLTADIVLENSGQTEVMIMGQSLSFDVWGLFVLGLATGVLVVAGVQITMQGFARDRYRRRMERHRAEELAAMTRAAPAPPQAPGPASTGPQPLKTPPQTPPQSTGPQRTAPQRAEPPAPPTSPAPAAAGSSPAATPTAPGQTSGRRSSASSAGRTGGGAAPAPATSPGTGAPASGAAVPTSHRGDRVVARVSDLRRKKGEAGAGSDDAASQRPLGSATAPLPDSPAGARST